MKLTPEMIADIAINIVNIIVLFVVVRFLAYKPVKKFMDARSARLDAVKADAEKKADEAQIKIAECDAVLADSEKVKQQALEQGETLAREQSEKLINEAKAKAKSIIDEADKRTGEEHDKMLKDAQDEVVALALEVSSKLLSREVTDEDNRKIAERFLSEINGYKR